MANRGWTEEEFEAYWAEIVAARTAVQEGITRCGDPDYEAHDDDHDHEDDGTALAT